MAVFPHATRNSPIWYWCICIVTIMWLWRDELFTTQRCIQIMYWNTKIQLSCSWLIIGSHLQELLWGDLHRCYKRSHQVYGLASVLVPWGFNNDPLYPAQCKNLRPSNSAELNDMNQATHPLMKTSYPVLNNHQISPSHTHFLPLFVKHRAGGKIACTKKSVPHLMITEIAKKLSLLPQCRNDGQMKAVIRIT